MKKAEEVVRLYLPKVNVMQLATASDNKPWACTIHYYNDDNLNLYWISTLERRHSQDIAANPNVAATVMVHENNADEPYVIGITIEGTAELLDEPDDKIVLDYISKLNQTPSLMDDIRAGRNPHRFYKLTPKSIVLFDNKNFPDDPRQEIEL